MPDRDHLRESNAEAGGPDEAALAIVARHALHDEELVAALAAGALDFEGDADERTRARSLLDRCPACRAAHDDVAAIGASLRAAATFTTMAPRDFRLTVDDAHRLGGTVTMRGPLGSFRRAFLGIARPFGASVAALGMVGILVGSAVLGSAGLGAGVAQDQGATNGALAPSEAARTSAPGAAPSTFEVAIDSGSSPKASERVAFAPVDQARDGALDTTAWLLVVSLIAVALGIGLFVYGTNAGRRAGSGSGSH